MAMPKTTGRMIIQLGNGATPTEVFGFPCGINEQSVTMTNNPGEEVLMDCDTPLDVPTVISRYLETQDTAVTLSGQLALPHLTVWRTWADTAVVRNIRIRIDESGANGGGYWQLPATLQSFELGKSKSGIITVQASLIGAGLRVWTAAT